MIYDADYGHLVNDQDQGIVVGGNIFGTESFATSPDFNLGPEKRGFTTFFPAGTSVLNGSTIYLDFNALGGTNDNSAQPILVESLVGDGSITPEDWSGGEKLASQTFRTNPARFHSLNVTDDIRSFYSRAGTFSALEFRFTATGRDTNYPVATRNLRQVLVATDYAREVLRNAIEVNPIASGPNDEIGITASFRPFSSLGTAFNGGVLAAALGTENFRWVQTVAFPPSWKIYIINGVFDKNSSDAEVLQAPRTRVANIQFDPITEPSKTLLMVRADNGQFAFWHPNKPLLNIGVDNQDFYFTHGGSGGGPIKFQDFPVQPEGMFAEGEYLQFETSLVGVLGDGSYKTWENLNTNFRWKSNTTYRDPSNGIVSQGFLSASIEDFESVEYSSGGVFDIEVVSVPSLGDVDLNGSVDFLDINPFIQVLAANGFQAEADIDGNGVVDFLDIFPFIEILAGL